MLSKNINHILLTVLMALFVWPSHAAEPKPFTAQYHIIRDGNVIGNATISLHPMGGGKWRYITTSKASVFLFSISDTETSVIQFKDQSVIPLTFTREQNKPTRLSRTEQNFDWAKNIETGNKDEKKQWRLLLEPNVQTRHSQDLLLRRDLQSGLKELNYRISESGKLRDYKYLVSEKETVETPSGKYAAVKVERDRVDSTRQTISWHAPELDYIPIKVRQIEDGMVQADLILTAIEL